MADRISWTPFIVMVSLWVASGAVFGGIGTVLFIVGAITIVLLPLAYLAFLVPTLAIAATGFAAGYALGKVPGLFRLRMLFGLIGLAAPFVVANMLLDPTERIATVEALQQEFSLASEATLAPGAIVLVDVRNQTACIEDCYEMLRSGAASEVGMLALTADGEPRSGEIPFFSLSNEAACLNLTYPEWRSKDGCAIARTADWQSADYRADVRHGTIAAQLPRSYNAGSTELVLSARSDAGAFVDVLRQTEVRFDVHETPVWHFGQVSGGIGAGSLALKPQFRQERITRRSTDFSGSEFAGVSDTLLAAFGRAPPGQSTRHTTRP